MSDAGPGPRHRADDHRRARREPCIAASARASRVSRSASGSVAATVPTDTEGVSSRPARRPVEHAGGLVVLGRPAQLLLLVDPVADVDDGQPITDRTAGA